MEHDLFRKPVFTFLDHALTAAHHRRFERSDREIAKQEKLTPTFAHG